MELTSLIEAEIRRVLWTSEKAFDKMGRYLRGGESAEQKGLLEEVAKANEKIKAAKREFGKIPKDKGPRFSHEVFGALKAAYNTLENGIPDHEETEILVRSVLANLDSEPIAKSYRRFKNRLLIPTAIGALSAASSLFLGCDAAAGIYGAAALAGGVELLSKKDSGIRALGANVAVISGAATLGFTYDYPPSALASTLFLGTIFIHYAAVPSSLFAAHYTMLKGSYFFKAHLIRAARVNLDTLARSGIVIREAERNLRYVKNVIESERRSPQDFQPQVDHLYNVLTEYMRGEAIFDDIQKAKVHYILPIQQKRNGKSDPTIRNGQKKSGLTPEAYADFVRSREPEGSEAEYGRKEGMPKSPSPPMYPEPSVHVSFSDELVKMRRDRAYIGKYGAGTLMDLASEKVQGNPDVGQLLREVGNGVYLIKRLRAKHGLDPNDRLFKMNQRKSLRALYARSNGEVRVLEILTHQDYERMMKPM